MGGLFGISVTENISGVNNIVTHRSIHVLFSDKDKLQTCEEKPLKFFVNAAPSYYL